MSYRDDELIDAAAHNDEDLVLKLLEGNDEKDDNEKIDPNAMDGFGWTALHEACAQGTINPRIIDALLDAGADPNHTTTEGFSCLMLAVARKDTEIVEKLVNAGADIEHLNGGRISVLFHAAGSPNPDMVNTLVKAGVNLDAKNKDGDTALHVAIRKDADKHVARLVRAGADINATDANGESARDLSERLSKNDGFYKAHIALLKAKLERDRDQKPPKPPSPPVRGPKPPGA